jgi:hypothetical protein
VLPSELTVTEAMRFSGYMRCHIYNLIHQDKVQSRRAKMRAGLIVLLVNRASLEEYMKKQGRAANGGQDDATREA